MNKSNVKKIIIPLLILLLLILSYYLGSYFQSKKSPNNINQGCVSAQVDPLTRASNTPTELMTDADKQILKLNRKFVYEVLSRDDSNAIRSYEQIGVESKPIPLEVQFMTDAEKVYKNMQTSTKAQVIERDSAGQVTSYKIINTDADILHAY